MNETYDKPLDEQSGGDFEISGSILTFLNETRKWARFIAIVGFVMVGFFVLAGLAVSLFFSSFSEAMGSQLPFSGGAFGLIYIVMALIYFFPILYLYRFSSNMKTAIDGRNQQDLHDAFKYLKSHYKYIGILMIILLGLYALGIVFGMLGGMMAMF